MGGFGHACFEQLFLDEGVSCFVVRECKGELHSQWSATRETGLATKLEGGVCCFEVKWASVKQSKKGVSQRCLVSCRIYEFSDTIGSTSLKVTCSLYPRNASIPYIVLYVIFSWTEHRSNGKDTPINISGRPLRPIFNSKGRP